MQIGADRIDAQNDPTLPAIPIRRKDHIPFFRIPLDSNPKSGVLSAPFRPGRRGVRVVTTRGAGCGGCDGVVRTSDVDRSRTALRRLAGVVRVRGLSRTLKSCGPDIPTLMSTHDEASLRAGMVARKLGAPGRSRIRRKAHRAGNAG